MESQEKPKKKFYKKWWFWVLLIFVIIVISSANNDDPKKIGDAQGNTNVNQNESSSEKEIFKIGDKIQIKDSAITVNEIEYSAGGQYSKPAEGNKWLNLNVTIENSSQAQQYVTTLGQMFIRDGAGNSYQVSVTNKAMENPGLGLDGQVLANSKRTGWVGFEIPKDSQGLQFQYNSTMFGGKEVLVNLQ